MADNRPNRYYDRSAYSNHDTPRSTRQSTPLDYGPKHVGIRRDRSKKPIEQTPKHERIGK